MKKSSHLLPYIGRYCLLLPLLLGLAACASESDEVTGAWVEEYGDPPRFLDPVAEPESSKEDGIGVAGPKTSWDSSDYAVWTPTQLWTKVTPEAGLAWPANSGLTWEGKYSAWVASLEKIPAVNGYTTFQLTNPQGKTLPAPALECAEVAIFLRATFAAWYRLPFFMEARDARGRLFLGHFGFRRADGTIYASSPKYKTLYKDYTATWRAGQAWPSDTRLASRGLYGGGDEMTFLPDVNGKPALAGAYFDQLFLDKRVGHYLLSALGWFGAMHLADSANMYHLKPEAMRAGDVLLERFQSSGIGHTIPVMRVKLLESQRREVAIATGSMPRRQPVWEEGNGVTYYFTNAMMGGPGTNGDGEAYAALGGGLRRWRTPLNTGAGTYRNSVLEVDQNSWINSTNLEAIAARCAQFEELLGEMSPATKRDLALGRISVAREARVQHPSSCTSRTRREDAFKDLYRVMSEDFGMSKAQVDSRYRIFADYVLAELEYNKSRSCCWNSTTPAMYDIIMLFNEDLQQQAEARGQCVEPVVFMGRDRGTGGDGFQLFQNYAVQLGRGSEWVAWSIDEPCPQAQVVDDIEVAHEWAPWCELSPRPGEGGASAGCGAANGALETAAALTLGTAVTGRVCAGEERWYSFSLAAPGQAKVVLRFSHAEGDLDLVLADGQGRELGTSQGTADVESIQLDLAAGSYRVRVYGYSSAEADFSLTVTN